MKKPSISSTNNSTTTDKTKRSNLYNDSSINIDLIDIKTDDKNTSFTMEYNNKTNDEIELEIKGQEALNLLNPNTFTLSLEIKPENANSAKIVNLKI